MVAPTDSVEINALDLLLSPALGDLLHINDITDSNNSFKITLQTIIQLYDALAVTMTNKTLTTPTIGSFTNAAHSHLNAAGGGTITEAAISDLGTYFDTAGTGLTSSGSTVNVIGTASRITANANDIDIASDYVGQATITTLGTIATGTWQGTTVAVNQGGTGVTTSTGTTNVVLSGSPTIVTPTITSLTNAQHDHTNAAGGGTILSTTALSDTADIAYLNTANIFIAGNKQTVSHSATTAGINVAPIAGTPSAQANGDVWLNDTSNQLFARINGADVDLGAGAGGGETNTASNVGAGVGVFDQKSGVDLEFNSLIGGTGIDVTDTTQDLTIAIDSTVATLTGAQILTNKTLTLPQINDTSADHQYIFGVSELAADRTVTLPLLAGNDTFVFNDFAATLTNKTIALGSNTVSGTAAQFDTAVTDDNFAYVSDNLSVFAATTSAQLAGVISNETGSGLLVFGTSPTIVTPTIASFTNATHDHTNAAGGSPLTVGTAVVGTAAQFDTALSDDNFMFDGATNVVTGAIQITAGTMRIPLSATPTMAVDGDFAVDTTITDFSHGLIKYFDGEELAVVSLPIAQLTTPTGGHIISYNATNDEFELVAAGAADNLGNHTATEIIKSVTFGLQGENTGQTMIGTDASNAWTYNVPTGDSHVFNVNAVNQLTIDVSTINFHGNTITNTGVLTLPTSTDTLIGKATTDVLTNKSYDEAGTGNVLRTRKGIQLTVVDFTTDVATGDGKFYFHIDSTLGGMDLVDVHAEVITAGTTGTTDIQINNVTQGADMLSTVITIDSAETGSDTAAAAAVIDTANDDVAENDVIRIDVDAISTTAPKGLLITLGFKTP